VRLHGFQRPFHILQVGSWIYFAIKSASFYILVAPAVYYYTFSGYVLVQIIYGIMISLIIILTVYATKKDCTDPLILLQRKLHG